MPDAVIPAPGSDRQWTCRGSDIRTEVPSPTALSIRNSP